MHVGEVLRSRRQNDAVSRTGTKKAITRVPSVHLLIWINPPIRFPCRRILIYISGLLATIRLVGIIRIRTPPFLAERLKDTYTIRRLQAGDDPTLVAENLGHADPSTLFRDYARFRPKATDIRRAARDAQQIDTGTGPTLPASAVARVSAQVKPRNGRRSLRESPNTMTAKRLGRGGKRRVGLPPVDSNHHSRIQSPMSCHWTRGQLYILQRLTMLALQQCAAA